MSLFWQYQNLTDLQTFITLFNEYANQYKLPDLTDVDKTYGYGLNILAKIVGIDKRPIIYVIEGFAWNRTNWNQELWNESSVLQSTYQNLSDGNFRKLIKMRMEQLIKPRTYDNILKLIDDFFPTLNYTYTFTVNLVTINYDVSSISYEEEVILTGGYILMPQGSEIVINSV